MLKKLLFHFLLLFISNRLFAQINLPQEAEITTGQVTARVATTGALINDFLVPAPAGDSMISLLGEVSMWMGGKDPGGYLFMAIQRKDSLNDQFVGGFRGIPQSKGIWKITKAELKAHWADFADNGHIDNPISSIYAWPAAHNPFSMALNGFSTDTLDKKITASFQDLNNDGIYNPDDGDYPFGAEIGIFHSPTDLLFTPFHVNLKSKYQVNASKLLDCSAMVFSYDCDDANFLEAAAFCRVSSVYRSPDPLDEFYLAFFVDGNIGGKDDDYVGSNLYSENIYFYNGDNFDENGFGSATPMLAFNTLTVLLDTFSDYIDTKTIISIYPTYEIPPPHQGTEYPTQDVEYYRYMQGKWLDGLPLTFGGNGKNGVQPTPYIFQGNPADPTEWSEVSEHNIPGDRHSLLSTGPITLLPNAHNQSLFSLTSIPPNPIVIQIEDMNSYLGAHFGYFYFDYFPPEESPFDTITCLHPTTSTNLVSKHPVRLFPNPAHDQITLQTEDAEVASISLYSILGVPEWINNYPNLQETTLQIPVKSLPPGIHLLQCIWKDGYRKTWKIQIE